MNTEHKNPYVGPRSFRKDEAYLFHGRDREARDLNSLVASEQLVLFYAQSGAGKSSLVNTSLIPHLETKKYEVFRIGRVSGEGYTAIEGENVFIFNLMRSLVQQELDLDMLNGLCLRDFLAGLKRNERGYFFEGISSSEERDNPKQRRALIIDQFEEIFTTHLPAWRKREGFFQQLAQAMEADPYLTVILVMREDYIASMDPYAYILPGELRVRYYMQRLKREAALGAIQKPVANIRPYAPGVAEKLVADLSSINIQTTDQTMGMQIGQYIEPVQLQVVCYSLWEGLSQGNEITEKDLQEVGDVNQSLGKYYDRRVQEVARAKNVKERLIREWFEKKLITAGRLRNMVLQEREVKPGELQDDVIQALQSDLVRAEKRGGVTWYELTHDRLVDPILERNKVWFDENLSPLQRQATLWKKQGQKNDWLLTDKALEDIQEWANNHQDELAEEDTAFLEECRKYQAQLEERRAMERRELEMTISFAKEQERSAQRAKRFTWIALTFFGIAMVAAIIAFQAWRNAENERKAAQAAEKRSLDAQTALELQKNMAKESARISHLGELAGLALSEKDNRFDQALLFGIEGYKSGTTSRTEGALLSLLDSHPGLIRYLHWHKDWVNAVAFNPDGKILASGSQDNTVVLWDMSDPANPLRIAVLEGHSYPVNSVAFSPDGKTLASGSDDYTTILWNIEDSARPVLLSIIEGHTDSVYSVTFSPDGKTLASASSDATVILWNIEDLAHPVRRSTLEGHSDRVESIAFSPDGKFLASASDDNTIILWNVENPTDPVQLSTLEGHSDIVNRVAFSPNGKTLASASSDATIILWNVENPAQPEQINTLQGYDDIVLSLAFSHDGKKLASSGADYNIIIWDITDSSNPSKLRTFIGHSDWVRGIAFSPDGKILVSCSDDTTIIIWNAVSPKKSSELSNWEGHDDEVTSIAYRADGQVLASASGDQTVILWNVEDPAHPSKLSTLKGHGDWVDTVAFSPDGKLLASGGDDDMIILWNVEDPAHPSILSTLVGHSDWVESVAFSPDGKTLASGSGDQTVILWNVENPAHPSKLSTLKGHSKWIGSVAFSPVGKILASGGSDKTIILWNVDDPKNPNKVSTLREDNKVESLAFSPNGKQLASGTYKTVMVWDISDPANIKRVAALTGHGDIVYSVAFSPDGTRLASGSYRTVILWDTSSQTNPQILATLTGHHGYINSIAFEPDNKTIASASGEIIIRSINRDQMIDLACQIAGRNFTLLQWRQYFPGEQYRRTCSQWAKDEGYYHELIKKQLSNPSTSQQVQNALNTVIDQMQDDPPVKNLPAEAARIVANTTKEEVLFHENFKEFDQALSLLQEAESIQIPLNLDAGNLNNLCWDGSLWGYSERVLKYCEQAVTLAPLDGDIRDSLAMAQALTGDYTKAIENFEEAISLWKENGIRAELIPQREDWIKALKSGKNPFDDAALETLRNS